MKEPSRPQRCPRCGGAPCRCPPRRSPPPEEQTAVIRREKKGRGGKTVTVVTNLRLRPEELEALGKHLRQGCGTGGTVKEGTIEVQGDQREKVVELLRALGYACKLAGG
ncbi:MAG TPA: translation initiation factor [Anaerolineae bacterium]|nr:translation initiation factor [Anaerolineae bacterium]